MKVYRYTIFTATIEENISKGILKPGDRLPSVRRIKEEYKLSTSSVQQGYDYLVFKGLVTSIPRSGYSVALPNKNTNKEQLIDLPAVPRDAIFSENIVLTSHKQSAEFTSFHAATPSDFLIPQKLVLRTMQQVNKLFLICVFVR